MSFKVLILSFGMWLPASHKYFQTQEEAEQFRQRLIRNQLGGHQHLAKVVEVGRERQSNELFEMI